MKKIGIAVHADVLRAAVFNEENKILDLFETPNDRTIRAQDNLEKVVRYIQEKKDGCTGIGISFPGPLDIPAGKVLNPPNLAFGWGNFRIVQYLQAVTGLPVVMNKDGNAESLAEVTFGAGKGYKSVYYLRISTGIGGGFIYDGKIVSGAHSSAAEVYDMIVNDDPHSHNGINAGSFNEQASVRGLEILAKEAYGKDVTIDSLFSAYRENDQTAVKIVNNAIDVTAKAIANIGFVIDPDVFIMSGIFLEKEPAIFKEIEQRTKKYWIHPESLKLLPAVLGKDASLLGAALLVQLP